MRHDSKKILVPVDFSPASVNAFDHALSIAKNSGKSLLLLYMIQLPENASVSDYLFERSQLEYEIRKMIDKAFLKRVNAVDRSIIKTSIRGAYNFADKLLGIAESECCDTLIIPVGSDQGLASNLGGDVHKLIHCRNSSVWVVPFISKSKQVKKILYATDLYRKDISEMKELRKLAESYKAEVIAFHLGEQQSFQEKNMNHNLSSLLNKGNDLINALKNTARKSNADMIVMLKKERDLLESVFSQNYISKLALQTDIPLFICN